MYNKSKNWKAMIIVPNKQWNIRISDDLDAKVERAAEIMGIGKTEVIRFAVAHFVGSMLGALDKVGATMDSAMKFDIKENMK